jgi:hypothetical protein
MTFTKQEQDDMVIDFSIGAKISEELALKCLISADWDYFVAVRKFVINKHRN